LVIFLKLTLIINNVYQGDYNLALFTFVFVVCTNLYVMREVIRSFVAAQTFQLILLLIFVVCTNLYVMREIIRSFVAAQTFQLILLLIFETGTNLANFHVL
jgi:hypothetical protein